MLRLTQSLRDVRILVDLRVQFELQFLLRAFDKEVTDSLGNRIPDITNRDPEVGINSSSNFLNEGVGAFFVLVILHDGGSVLIWIVRVVLLLLSLAFLVGRHNLSSILEVVNVVGKKIVLL
jgi:hypothetical protein